ncbi:MAG: glycoside hydrolase family 25 protein [Aminipila sp.]
MKTKYKVIFILLIAIFIYQINTGSFLGISLNNDGDSSLAESEESYEPYPNLPKHQYDWNRLVNINGRTDYTSPYGVTASQGIDVSKYQGDIDWYKVKNSGISFAMLRVGYRGYKTGIVNMDEKFIENIRQASQAGVDIGIYFFSQAISESEAIEEAEFVLNSIGDYNISYPIVFDLEEISDPDHRTYYLNQQERTNIANAFCSKIEKAGYTAMIYGNESWLTDCYDLNQIYQYDIWLAQYSQEPTFPYEFTMWQYTDKGLVDGIDHAVDLNICFKQYQT